MYHRLRSLHRWAGLTASIFLIVIAGSGILLATKYTFGWIRPPEQKGVPIEGLGEVVSIEGAAEAAFAVGLENLQTKAHIDRIDYRPESNIFKVASKEGYHEVQVCGKTGQVLSVAFRTYELVEDIHDLSWFAESMHTYWLPVVAVLLFTLGCSGIWIFFVPIYRRIRFRRSRR